MAEWSQLPGELLNLIATHLGSAIDTVRFRSVCSSWRAAASAAPGTGHNPPFSSLSNDGFAAIFGGFFLSKRTIYLLTFPQNRIAGFDSFPDLNGNSGCCPWLIKTEQKRSGSLRLFNPLSRSRIKPFSASLPATVDLSNVRVSELGQEYVLQYVNHTIAGDRSNLYMEKVAYLMDNDRDHVLLTVHVSGKLAIYRSGDEKWIVIDDQDSLYDDVIAFDGFFHAVDNTGRTVRVKRIGSSNVLEMVAQPVYGGDKKCLVTMNGDLILVDIYMTTAQEDVGEVGDGDDQYEGFDSDVLVERTVRFKAYKLDKKEHNWVELQSLGDHVLFLGDNCAFSASASKLLFPKGNRICFNFSENPFPLYVEEGDASLCHDIGLFNLEDGNINLLSNDPAYSRLLWPPPQWIGPASHEPARVSDESENVP